jgi:hypothetical protein
MARIRNSLATIIVGALVLVLLYGLNPSIEDFKAWRANQAVAAAGGSNKDFVGVLKKGAGAMAGAMVGAMSGAFERKDYLIFSTYSVGAGKSRQVYLGAARLFVKLK